MNAETATAQPAMMLHVEASISPNTRIHVSSTSLNEVAAIMAHFNLVTPDQVPASGNDKPATPSRRKTDKAETPAATPPAPAPAATAPAPAATAPAPTPASPASAPQAASGSGDAVTPQQAAEAVRAYGAKNGIDAAKALMAKHGVDKTANITAEKAPAIFAEATGANAAQDL